MITQLDRVGLVVSDGDRSLRFYTECLGMELVSSRQSTQVTPIVGTVFDVPGAIIRRLIRLNKGAFYLILFEIEPRGRQEALPLNNPGALTLSLASDNFEEDCRRVRSMAPQFSTPPTSPGGGRKGCYALDPDGAVAGFTEHLGPGIDALASVTVDDAARSAAFYANFGLAPDPELDEATADCRAVGMKLGSVAFQFNEYLRGKGAERVSPMNNVGAVQFDFFSDDVEADYKRVRDYGATVISPPVPTGRGFTLASTGFDPDGVMWELSSDDGVTPKTPEYYRSLYRRG